MLKSIRTVFITFICIYSNDAYFQKVPKIYKLSNKADSTYYGIIVTTNNDTIGFKIGEENRKYFSLDEIEELKTVKSNRIFTEGRRSIYSSQLFYTETAIPIEANCFYFQNTMIFDGKIGFAASKYLQFELGNDLPIVEWYTPLNPYFAVKANASFLKNNLHVAIKFNQYFKDDYDYYYINNDKKLQTLAGTITIGNKEASLTFAIRRLFNAEVYYEDNTYNFYSWGGSVKVSKRNYFNIEHIILNRSLNFIAAGIRHDRLSISYTYGLFYFSGYEGNVDSEIPLPYLSIKVPLHSN